MNLCVVYRYEFNRIHYTEREISCFYTYKSAQNNNFIGTNFRIVVKFQKFLCPSAGISCRIWPRNGVRGDNVKKAPSPGAYSLVYPPWRAFFRPTST